MCPYAKLKNVYLNAFAGGKVLFYCYDTYFMVYVGLIPSFILLHSLWQVGSMEIYILEEWSGITDL